MRPLSKRIIGTEEQRRFAKNAVRNPNAYCVYCGDWFECLDHYVPIAWTGYHRSFRAGEVVPCCRECNALLGRLALFSLAARAEYLLGVYPQRAQKWLKVPLWSKAELSEMGYAMRCQIERALTLRAVYIAKLKNLDLTALGYEAVPIP